VELSAKDEVKLIEGITIKGYLHMSLIDYSGKIVSLVFLPRCNFRCPFCFNVDLVNDSDSLKMVEPEEIFEHLKSQKKWLDGICITGGEPTLHKGLPEFIKEIKKLGFLVKLDTNGTNPEMLENLVKNKLVDYIAMDIKGPLEKYRKITRSEVDEKTIQKSVDIIRNSGIDYEFRTTAVPKILSKKEMEEIGKWLKGSKKYCLQQFRSGKTLDKKYENEKPYTPDELKELAEIARPFFDIVEVRGI